MLMCRSTVGAALISLFVHKWLKARQARKPSNV